MKIVYFYQYFSTPNGSWGTRVYEFASEWVKKGHEVTVVSSIYSKSDLTATQLVEDQVFNGIHVKVINVLIDNKQPKMKRIGSFIKYAVLSSWYALTLDADVVIASSGPITVGLPGLIARYGRGRPLVFETRDLWPDGAIELGFIKNNSIKKIAYWFESRCYQAARLIVTLSPGMKTHIEVKHHHKNVISVTNAANIDLFAQPQVFPSHINVVQPLKYAIYTGNIGEVNNSHWLYQAALSLTQKGHDDIVILLVGEGQQREELEKLASENGVKNFIRLGLMPKKDLVPLIQYALVSLVPLKGTPVLDTSSPNKFFESLAAGVPVIQNTNGWMKDFLTVHQIGFTIAPDAPELLADKLIEMDTNPVIREAIHHRAIQVAKENFDKNSLANVMLEAIEQAVKS